MYGRPVLPANAFAVFSLALIALQSGSAQDTIRMKSTTPPLWGPNVGLTPVFSVGTLDGPPEYSFGSVGAVAVDRKGNTYIDDGQSTQIRKYDAAGKFLFTVGRKGSGPGEYESVDGMSVVQDSLLAVFDPRNKRVTLFKPDGNLLSSFREPRVFNWIGTDLKGLIYISATLGGKPFNEEDMTKGGPSALMYLRITPDGTHQDSLLLPPSRDIGWPFYLMTPDGGSSNFVPETFITQYTGGGVLSGDGDKFRFVIKLATGAPRVVERAWTPVPLGAEEREQWMAFAAYNAERDKGAHTYVIPKVKPAYRDLTSDREGRVWVSVYGPAEKVVRTPRPAGDLRPLLTWYQHATYEVFDPLGVYLGRVVLPLKSQLMAAQGNRIWVLIKGKDDEDIVQVYTLRVINDR